MCRSPRSVSDVPVIVCCVKCMLYQHKLFATTATITWIFISSDGL